MNRKEEKKSFLVVNFVNCNWIESIAKKSTLPKAFGFMFYISYFV